MFPTILELTIPGIGNIPLYSFGFCMLLCFLGAMLVLQSEIYRAKVNKNGIVLDKAGSRELAEEMITWAAIGGILGARLLSILSNLDNLFIDPIGVIFSAAGFVFYGGFIGGIFSVWLLLKKRGIIFYQMSDIVCTSLVIGYAIGRIGCQLSGDGDYGSISSLPWATSYKYGVIPTLDIVHPTPVYESLYAIFVLVCLVSNKVRQLFSGQGQLFGLYLVLMSIGRFLVEFLRIEPIVFSIFSQAQVISFFLFCFGVFMILIGQFSVAYRGRALTAVKLKNV